MPISRENLAWAAGFLEGEGTFSKGSKRKRGVDYSPKIRVFQAGSSEETPPETLMRLQTIFGFGRVRRLHHMRGAWNKRPMWSWDVYKYEYVQALVAFLWHWLSPFRREQARNMLYSYHLSRGHKTWQ